MNIRTVSIIGDGELVLKLQELLAKVGVRVITSDLTEDYTKQAADVNLVLEVTPEYCRKEEGIQKL